MNIIVDKLYLPRDMKREIYKYCYDTKGYTMSHINTIKNIKGSIRNKFMKVRLKLELGNWYKYNVSVSWLRGGGVYGKKNPSSVYGGGTLAESQNFRYYNGITCYCKGISDPENEYIEKMIVQGDRDRNI
jgi:hypothetical protein